MLLSTHAPQLWPFGQAPARCSPLGTPTLANWTRTGANPMSVQSPSTIHTWGWVGGGWVVGPRRGEVPVRVATLHSTPALTRQRLVELIRLHQCLRMRLR